MRRGLALLALLALLVPGAALAAPHRTTAAAVEQDAMCVQCGTPLAVSNAPSADRERALIRSLVDRGWTKARIERKLVAEYGPNVLATPSNHGFDVSNWLVPVLLAIAAVAGIALTVRRWRRAGAAAAAEEPRPAPLAEPDAQRLERDMATYDL